MLRNFWLESVRIAFLRFVTIVYAADCVMVECMVRFGQQGSNYNSNELITTQKKTTRHDAANFLAAISDSKTAVQ